MKPEIQEKLKNIIEIPSADDSSIDTPSIPIIGDPTSIEQSIVYVSSIKGSAYPSNVFDKYFRPKKVTPKFKRIWKYVWISDKTTMYFNHIKLAKINDDFYVLDGLQRVSGMKHQGWEKARFEVQDYSYLTTLSEEEISALLKEKSKKDELNKLTIKKQKAKEKRKRYKRNKKLKEKAERELIKQISTNYQSNSEKISEKNKKSNNGKEKFIPKKPKFMKVSGIKHGKKK